jgi:heat shock protein HslJ
MATIRRAGLLALIAIAVGACAGTAPSEIPGPGGPILSGTGWRVVSVGGRPPAAGAPATIAFGVRDVTGSGGCNSFGGGYTFEPSTGRLAFGDNLAMTAMACLEGPRNDFETAFFQALIMVTNASLVAGRLTLSGPAGEIVLAPA